MYARCPLPKRICAANRVISDKGKYVNATRFSDWISVQPPLGIRIVEAVQVVIESAVGVEFLAGEAVEVGVIIVARGSPSVSVVLVPPDFPLVDVRKAGDVAVAVRVVKFMGGVVTPEYP